MRTPILSRGMLSVLIAQFLSALADNALLFAAIATLQQQAAPGWQTPLLQAAFVIAFIVLAPFVGTIADALPKGHVMLLANLLKLVGTVALLSGLHPLTAYSLVGVGAAAYSPAKYGILSELVETGQLVKANGLMEGSTIVAILLGTVAGGKLAETSPTAALLAICLCYALAGGANALIPRLPAAHAGSACSPGQLVRDFCTALTTLLRQNEARFSLLGTSIFWGAGATLRLLLVAWVPAVLGIANLGLPASLSGLVAIGIALGAASASALVRLDNVNRVLPAGLLIGVLILSFAHIGTLYPAMLLLILIGLCGGFYVVPLNALLQHQGQKTTGTGHAVAVQNFLENFAMLILVGLYSGLEKTAMPVISTTLIFGSVVLAAMTLLATLRWHSK